MIWGTVPGQVLSKPRIIASLPKQSRSVCHCEPDPKVAMRRAWCVLRNTTYAILNTRNEQSEAISRCLSLRVRRSNLGLLCPTTVIANRVKQSRFYPSAQPAQSPLFDLTKPIKMLLYLHITQASLSIERGKRKERLFEMIRREKIKTFRSEVNVVQRFLFFC